jgi:hypothetical protein
MAVLRVPLLTLALLASALPLAAADRLVNEYEVKAAFLYNFAMFAEWPREAFADAMDPIATCVFGEHNMLTALQDAVQGKTIAWRGIAARKITNEAEARKCHMVFFSDSERKRLAPLVAALAGSHVLMVGESNEFLEQGGIINLRLRDSRVRIEINLEAAGRSKCRISSKLIRLADSGKK